MVPEVFGPDSRKLQELGENRIMKCFMIYTPRQMLGWSKQGRLDWWDMWHVWGGRQIRAGFRWGKPARKGLLRRRRLHLFDSGSGLMRAVVNKVLNLLGFINREEFIGQPRS